MRLRSLRHGGVAVDYCVDCGGLWFDGGELARVFGSAMSPPERLGVGVAGDSSRGCPHGHGRMRVRAMTLDRSALIDWCPACHGIWLDRGELLRLRAQMRVPAVADGRVAGLEERVGEAQWEWEKSQGEREEEVRPEPGEWWFQFLLGLPREVSNPMRIRPLATYALIALNGLVFLLQQGSPDLFVGRWGLVPSLVLQGIAPWTLLSAMFMHGSFMHLFGNMYFLAIFGDNVEDRLGRINYLALYLLGGVFAFLAQVISDPAGTTPVIGASGAVSGVLGAYVYLFRERRIYTMIFFALRRIRAVWYLGIWLGLQLLAAAAGLPGIAWWAHIGGFLAGLIWGVAHRAIVRRRIAALEATFGH